MIATSVLALTLFAQSQDPAETDTRFGHSSHGAAFDTGLRTKPWKIEGIGDVNFAITTTNPETQAWFNQAIALMHSFWYEEARRSFRWCHKLEPQNPMTYWGLGYCATYDYGSGGAKENFTKAYELRQSASPRERQIIEIFYRGFGQGGRDARRDFRSDLRSLAEQYPQDIEIQALLLREDYDRIDQEDATAIAEKIFTLDPDHPGANHYLIHIWDAKDNERALKACRIYGDIAPASGHANHMPGHIYSKVGMWKEAAWAMDKAARVELKYMNDRLAMPFETWNYSHNRNYLLYIQEHLGLADRTLSGALNLLNSPRDPELNNLRGFGEGNQGLVALTRTLIRFERWEEILNPQGWSWPTGSAADQYKDLATAYASIATGNLEQGKKLTNELQSEKRQSSRVKMEIAILKGKLAIAEGNHRLAESRLKDAVDEETKMHRGWYENDPPSEPLSASIVRGNYLLTRGNFDQAVQDFNQALEYLPGNPWALAGLAKAHKEKGDDRRANSYAGQFLYIWSEADPDLPLLLEIKAAFPNANPIPPTVQQERPYRPDLLDRFGPSDWEPFSAPKLEGVGADGLPVNLSQFKGKNVIVVYYLSDECVHCMEQLVALNEKAEDFQKLDTVILAVSSTTPADNASSQKLKGFNLTLVSDFNHENARRWSSYDDFEEMELHSTVFIDKQGKVRWKRTGGDPFDNVPFLINEITRVNKSS